MKGLRVRAATLSDSPLLADLAERTWLDVARGVFAHEDLAAHLAEVRASGSVVASVENQTILVAEADDALVGWVEFGDVVIAEVDVRPGDQELRRLYVATSHQGLGLGRQLMTAALAHPRLAGARRVFLQVWEQNTKAIRLYESLGFRSVGTTTFRVGTHVQSELVLLLDRSLEEGGAPADASGNHRDTRERQPAQRSRRGSRRGSPGTRP
jgi:ribosomal protein S18 acetylase RimI-like enzyme